MASHSIKIRFLVERDQAQKGTTEDEIIVREVFDARCPDEEDAIVAASLVLRNWCSHHDVNPKCVRVDLLDVVPTEDR